MRHNVSPDAVARLWHRSQPAVTGPMGIKSESIFRRYNIRQNEDKRRGLEKVQNMLDFEAEKQERAKR